MTGRIAGIGVLSVLVVGTALGAEFGPERRLTFDPAPSELSFNFTRSIATGPDGAVHAVWTDGRDGSAHVYYKRSLDGGARWGPDRRLARGEHPSLAVDGASVYVVWHDVRAAGLGVFLRRSGDAGWRFEPEIPITGSGSGAHPTVAAAGPRVHVVWGDTRSGDAEVFTRRSLDGGAHFGPEVQLSESPYASWVPTVTTAGPAVYVAWVDYRDANEEEYIRRSLDGGQTWGPITRLTHDPADSWAPSIATEGRFVYVTWFDRRDAGLSDAEVEGVLDRTMALLGLRVFPAPPRNPAVYYLPGFHARVKRKLIAIWRTAPGWIAAGNDPAPLEALLEEFHQRFTRWARGWSIFVKLSLDYGETWGPDRRISAPGSPAARPSIAVSGPGVHVAWFDGRHGPHEIYTRESPFFGLVWGAERRLTHAGDSLRPSIAARGGRVHVLWSDDRDGNREIYTSRRVER